MGISAYHPKNPQFLASWGFFLLQKAFLEAPLAKRQDFSRNLVL